MAVRVGTLAANSDSVANRAIIRLGSRLSNSGERMLMPGVPGGL